MSNQVVTKTFCRTQPMPTPLLKMSGICKAYPGVQALRDVDIEVHAGQVLAIIGENGAGKSTLIKTLGGVHLPDSGSIELDGRSMVFRSPHQSQQAGVAVIHQELSLVPYLTARENIFLGRPQHRWGIIDAKSEWRQARKLLQELGLDIDLQTPVARLSIAQRQIVEIAKALILNVRILVMDEPTATLTSHEVERLFRIVRELKSQGIAVVYVSHRLDEVLAIADSVVVLRDGTRIQSLPIAHTNRRQLIEFMVGREIESEYPRHHRTPGPVRLSVEHLNWFGQVVDVSFGVRAGEVIGITGLVGAGRTELARLIAGATIPESGTIRIDAKPVSFRTPHDAIRAGVCLLTEDRKGQGLILNHSLRANFGLPNLDRFSTFGIMQGQTEAAALTRHVKQLQINATSLSQPAGQLSGGNQQKLVLAKWLERDCSIVVIDEPTRGIDVGAKYEIYLLINELARQGKAVIVISSELPEVLGIADRILVMRQGRMVAEIKDPESATQQQIMQWAAN